VGKDWFAICLVKLPLFGFGFENYKLVEMHVRVQNGLCLQIYNGQTKFCVINDVYGGILGVHCRLYD